MYMSKKHTIWSNEPLYVYKSFQVISIVESIFFTTLLENGELKTTCAQFFLSI